jgi:5-methyltetrahydropteroyltriglutamate--homocysteine methyltransferase
VHGFLERVDGIDFGTRSKWESAPTAIRRWSRRSWRPLRLKGRVHEMEARLARAHTKRKLKFTLPGPMTIVDTIADRHYGDKVKMAMAFAELLNQEARALEADGVDVIQFDEPAFNVYMDDVKDWGIAALHRAIEGARCKTAVHICYGYGIKANIDWKETLGGEWRQYEAIFPAARTEQNRSGVARVHALKVPMRLMKLLDGKDVLVGAIDVASDKVETPEEVAATIKDAALKYVPKERIFALHQLRHGADAARVEPFAPAQRVMRRA